MLGMKRDRKASMAVACLKHSCRCFQASRSHTLASAAFTLGSLPFRLIDVLALEIVVQVALTRKADFIVASYGYALYTRK